MIPEIGMMIALYVVTRMLEMMGAFTGTSVTAKVVGRVVLSVFGIITILFATITFYDLFTRGTTATPGL